MFLYKDNLYNMNETREQLESLMEKEKERTFVLRIRKRQIMMKEGVGKLTLTGHFEEVQSNPLNELV